MGQVGGRLKNMARPVKNYNVEERAYKVISKDKPTQAPVHQNMLKMMEEIKRDPDLLNKGKLDPITMQNLAKVYIKSEGTNKDISRKRHLPENRKQHDDFEFGYEEPTEIPKGKASIRQVLELLGKSTRDPDVNTPQTLALEYQLELVDVNNLNKYFKSFEVYIPPKSAKGPAEKNPLRYIQNKIDEVKK